MKPFVTATGVAAPFMRPNVDTDAIVPSREYQSAARTGFGEKLFANWRYIPGTRTEIPDFILNQPPYRQAEILVAGPNFGCGSSREWAVWALVEFGIRAIVAASFGAIFRSNCIRNGLLPVELPAQEVEALAAEIEAGAGRQPMTVDLERCVLVSPRGRETTFSISPKERTMLLQGLDEVAVTQTFQKEIDAFLARDRAERPWVHLDGR